MAKDIDKALKGSVEKAIKRIPPVAWFIVPGVLVLFLFAFALNLSINAQATGEMLGEGTGKLVGRAVGSLEGITIGQMEGYEAGKEEGLSAKDTSSELAGKIQEVEKLEVIVASGTFSDVLSIGAEKINYAALLSMKYNAVFTIDLGTANIELLDDGLHITLDQPSVEFMPIGEIEKRNEFQRPGFIIEPGSAEAGYIAADNSMNAMKVKARQTLQENETMMKAARTSAETQLKQLVNAVSISKPEVFVHFRGGAEND